MALMQTRVTDLPEDAVRLTKEQALAYQWKIIHNWNNTRESWPLMYGPGILGSVAAVSGFYINTHFRNKFKLGTYGRLSSYLPIVMLPAMITTLFHKTFIQPPIILEERKCIVCSQTRAGLIQSTLAVGYPLVLSPLASLMFATRHFTYRLPSITEKPKEILNLCYKMTKPITLNLTILLGINFFAALLIVYKEYDSYYGIKKTLCDFERNHEQNKQEVFH